MTRLVRFANNATSKLAANISNVGLTMSVTPGDGSKFPTLSGNQFFKATLIKSDGTKEVVKVTARSTDTMTIVRANESIAGVQTAYAFSAGDKVELRLTAQGLGDELDRLDAAAFLDVVSKSANYTVAETDISKLIKTDTTAGAVTITLPQISTLTGSFEVQIQKNTGDGNVVTVARSGSDTINGATSHLLASQYQCVWLVADLINNAWTAITSANASNKIADQFIGAGSAGPFTLSGDPGSKNNTDVYVGGVYQNKSTYTVTGTSLTLGGAVSAGVIIECNWAQPLPVGTPSDATVTPAKLADSVKTAIQSQTWTGFTSAGTAPAYTLTPTPTILAYAVGQRFRMAAHAAGTTGSNTLNIAGQGVKNLKQYDSAGVKIPAVIASGQLLDVEYDGTDMVVLNPLATPLSSTQGSFKNLQASAAGTGANISISADEIVVESASNSYQTLRNVSLTGSLAASGANGLDDSAPVTVTITIASPGVITETAHGRPVNAPVVLATTGALPTGLTAGTTYYITNPTTNGYNLSATKGGSAINTSGTQSGTHTAKSILAVNSWYSKWVIWNGTTTSALLSSSATNPALPPGYTHKARTGWVYTDSSGNKYPLSFRQFGRHVQYALAAGSNVTVLPSMASGAQGSVATPTWVAVAVANFVPPTASRITVVIAAPTSNNTIAAPNNQYGGYQSVSSPAPLNIINNFSAHGTFVLESTNIYYAASAASCLMQCMGWEDNL